MNRDSPEAGTHRPLPGGTALAAAIVVGVGGILRLWSLGAEGLWSDEATVWLWTRGGLTGLMEHLSVDVQPPLYYLAVMTVTKVLGQGETALRLVSGVSGTLTIPLLAWCLAPRFRSVAAGCGPWIGATFLALSPMHIHYSREAKSYGLLLLFLVAAWGCLERSLESKGARRRLWAGMYLASGVAMLATHMTAVFMVPAFLALALLRPGGHSAKELLSRAVTAALPGLMATPFLVLALRLVENAGDALSWAESIFWAEAPWQPVRSWVAFSPATSPPVKNLMLIWTPGGTAGELGPSGLVWIAAGALLSAGLACAALILQRRSWGLSLLVGVPLLGLLAASPWRPVYLVGRTDILALPAFCGLCGLGAAAMLRRRRSVGATLVAVWVLMAFASLGLSARDDYRSAGRAFFLQVRMAMTPADVLVIPGLRYPTALYYLRGPGAAAAPVEVLPFPEELRKHPGWEDLAAYHPESLHAEAQRLEQRSATKKVFVVYAGAEPEKQLVQAFQESDRQGIPVLDAGMKAVAFLPVENPADSPLD